MTGGSKFTLDFGDDRQAVDCLGRNWSDREGGMRWSLNSFCEVTAPTVTGEQNCYLILDVTPFVASPRLIAQRLRVSIGGRIIGAASLRHPSRLAFPLPRSILEASELNFVFETPDFARPSDLGVSPDSRSLAISFNHFEIIRTDRLSGCFDSARSRVLGAVSPVPEQAIEIEQRLAKPLSKLASDFCSLGGSCEFGLVQRKCGSEPLDLLRFAGVSVHDLMRALEDRFAKIDEGAQIVARLEGTSTRREYMVYEQAYNISYHPFVFEGDMPAEAIERRERRRLKFLRDKFLEDLAAGDRIFVLNTRAVNESEVIALALSIRAYGPGWVLWIIETPEADLWGRAELHSDGVFRAYIDRHAPAEDAHNLSYNVWLSICANVDALKDRLSTLKVDGSIVEPSSEQSHPEDIRMHIDSVGYNRSGELRVSGWALALSEIQGIEVTVDGMDVGCAQYGLSRPGVSRAFPQFGSQPNCGFVLTTRVANKITARNIRVRIACANGHSREAFIEHTPDEMHLDRVVLQASGDLDVRGWCLSVHGVLKVEIFVAGVKTGVADWHESPEIQDLFFDIPQSATARFSLDTNTGSRSVGEILEIVVVARLGNGETIERRSECAVTS